MKTEELNYYLPDDLIAQQPTDRRSDSRLLVFNRKNGDITDSKFSNIAEFLLPGDCLVLNDTKVLPARFFAQRQSGARLEGLFLTEEKIGLWQVLIKGIRKVKTGETIFLQSKANPQTNYPAQLLKKEENGSCLLKIDSNENVLTILDSIGYPPLPPYIRRTNDLQTAQMDIQRYQTVYAKTPGAVAAPTAGLHFTDELIDGLKQKYHINFAYLTLHVGAGTFKPITAETLEEHEIHYEQYSLDAANAQIINNAQKQGGRIIAVGTTSVRTLETVANDSKVHTCSGSTNLFITPGYNFKIVDAIITNFHLPKSSLLALVAAFAGLDNIMRVYRHAVDEKYRFYSYGDAMLIE